MIVLLSCLLLGLFLILGVVKSINYLQNGLVDTERGPSPAIWGAQGAKSGWVAEFLADPRLGMYFWDDFDKGGLASTNSAGAVATTYGQWACYAYQNATFTDKAAVGGILKLATSATASKGIALTNLCGTYQVIDSSSNYQGRIAFEARVAVEDIATAKFDAFVGLTDGGAATAGSPITTTGNSLYNSISLIGFQRVNSVGNDWGFVFQATGVAAVYPTNLQTLVSTVTGSAVVASTYYKLGFIYDPMALPQLMTVSTTGNSALVLAKPLIKVYVNGLPAAAFLTTTNLTSSNFPVTPMGPAIAIMNSSAAALALDIDWIRVAQEAIS